MDIASMFQLNLFKLSLLIDQDYQVDVFKKLKVLRRKVKITIF